MDTLARQLRSRVREEFFGKASSARERIKDNTAATLRHTTRDPMVLEKPLSSITGSILTNVPLPARVPAAGREPKLAPEKGRKTRAASKPTRLAEIEGGGDRADVGRDSTGVFW